MTAILTSPRDHAPARGTAEIEPDVDLQELKRELAAAKDRFLKLAQDAERARRNATIGETQARARLTAVAEQLADALAQPDGPTLRTAVQTALTQLRS
jgi:hypothetical protein